MTVPVILLLAFVALLAAVLLNTAVRAAADVRIAKHTGVDPRVGRKEAERGEAERPKANPHNALHYDERGRFVGPKTPKTGRGPASPPKGAAVAIDRIEGRGNPSGGPTN